MPVENEFKIVIRMDIEEHIQKIAENTLYIEQGYLLRNGDITLRVRRQSDGKDRIKHYLTVKHRVDQKIIEIEKKIIESDFIGLAKKAENWVTKIRYLVGSWEVDFFKKGTDTYFVMAEIELPDGILTPPRLPKFIVDNLLFSVPRDDNRFSSKKLSDLDHAKKLLQEILGRHPDQNNLGQIGI